MSFLSNKMQSIRAVNPTVEFTQSVNQSYKIGLDEIAGLETAMRQAFAPVQAWLKSHVYWNECDVDTLEYKSRDGFIAYSHNGGGLELDICIPKCESDGFAFLEFGECDGCNHDCSACTADDPDGSGECGAESEGHLDARLRIIFKFEGFDEETGELMFYLNVCGGNGDAPYFRLKSLADVYESEFTCKSVAGLKRAAAKHVKALLKAVSRE